MTTWTHLVARSYPSLRPLECFDRCAWLWARLRRAFRDALDVALMPNGLHLVVPSTEPDAERSRLGFVLRAFTRRYGNGQRLFEPLPAPVVLPDRLHRWRTSRYVPLNPCRAGIARDPLEWLWSTYRDVMGASVDPWVTAERMARAHGKTRAGFEQRWHAYVSGDPTVALEGTPLPVPAVSTTLAQHALARIQLASAAACRVLGSCALRSPTSRRLFVALARDQGWPPRVIAAAAGMSTRSVRRIQVAPSELAAARLCLGDDRLLVAVDDLSVARHVRKADISVHYRR